MVINIQDDILKLHALGLLDRLLQDKATKGNILWATDAYADLGEWYSPGNEIRPQRITGEWSDLIKTRARRAMEQRTERTRQHAEVFTPLWIVKKMNDFADEQWFERKSGIYKLTDEGKIYFNTKKHWKLYVDARRMEITCGEAPFLVTRYDVETGEAIPIEDRIGLLDRKLRAVTENTQDIEEWKTWALRAVQATYGYELQGDNLLIARVNILCSVEEHMFHRWRQRPDKAWLEKLCNVIAWNLWQMDGIHGSVPVPPRPTEEQLSLFPPLHEQTNLFGEMEEHDIPCLLYNWRHHQDQVMSYTALRKKGSELMKFDFIIGNPPYQTQNAAGTNDGNRSMPIYHLFMDEAFLVGNRVMLISPARFLFDAGKTPKEFNQRMLKDKHFKLVYYWSDSSEVFSGVDIKGGVSITLYDSTREFSPIGVMLPFPELFTIKNKVYQNKDHSPFSELFAPKYSYHFIPQMYEDYPNLVGCMSEQHKYDMESNVFDLMPEAFRDDCPNDGSAYAAIHGRTKNQRVKKYIQEKYITYPSNYLSYKVMVAISNGSGSFGEPLSTPFVANPREGNTVTFLSVGSFASAEDAFRCLKYMKTKFLRALLGALKITQHNPASVWSLIPIQDFTSASDIDWSKSIPEIDQQLYAKYGLDEKEIAFIESHVKEMS